MVSKYIDEYESGGDRVRGAVAGLTREDLLWTPPADAGVGLWSIQQIVIHLMDSDLIWATRAKCIIAEDHPKLRGYDESRFAARLFYERQDAERAIEILDLNHRQFSKALRKLPASAFLRTGEHNERGNVTLEYAVREMSEHISHHLKFIQLKREKLSKPVKA